MRGVIFTGPINYNIDELYEPQEGDYIIGADQGALHLANHNMKFDLAVGDYDSIDEKDVSHIREYAEEVLTFPEKKDFTDTYLAVQESLQRGYEEIVIYGGIGSRFDHSYANLHLLTLGNITLVSEHEIMYVLDPGKYNIENKHKYISFFAMEDVKRLTLEAFEYELLEVDLEMGNPLCISNQGEGTLSFIEGVLLVIHQNE